MIANQYAKGKEHLKPIYDLLKSKLAQFGEDVTFVPKKTNVSVRRSKQFALIQPSTKTRIDIGLKLKDTDFTDRLKGSGSFGSMCSHRVSIMASDEIDDELLAWLEQAYAQA